MNENELRELIHREIDGENTAADSQRLRGYLRDHPEAREFDAELREAIAMLEGMELADLPPELQRATMTALRNAAARRTRTSRPAARAVGDLERGQRTRSSERRNPMSRNTMIWSGVAAVVVVVIAVAVIVPSPDSENLPGAIGVAEQYRADQISAEDVVLEDPEIQDLLQSEFFYKLSTDAEFRKIAVEQLARLDVTSGRSSQFTSAASLESMKSFLDLISTDKTLRMALAEGRMDVVKDQLQADGKMHFVDIANRIYLTQGRQPDLNAANLGNMKVFLDQALSDKNLRMAMSEGRLPQVQAILIKEGRTDLSAAATGVYLAESRRALAVGQTNLADMRVFFEMIGDDKDLRTALSEGRMDVVHASLEASGRTHLIDLSNRVFVTLSQRTNVEAATLADMRTFLSLAADKRDLRVAVTSGRLAAVRDALTADGRAALVPAATLIFQAEGRRPNLQQAVDLGNMKAFLEMARTDVALGDALASGKMNIVHQSLLASGRQDLAAAANRIFLCLGSKPQLAAASLENMRAVVKMADANPDMRTALMSGRMDVVTASLDADKKMAYVDAAGRIALACNQSVLDARAFELTDMRVFLEMARTDVELGQSLASGRMDLVQQSLDAHGRTFLVDAANRIYLSLGRKPDLNQLALGDMRTFIDRVAADPNLRTALQEGRIAAIQKDLLANDRLNLADAAGRVYLAALTSGRAVRHLEAADMRAVAAFATDHAEFRQAVQNGDIDVAARLALEAGVADVSLRQLQLASVLVGDSRSFVTDLNRLASVVDTPEFRQVAVTEGWSRLLAVADGSSWRQTVQAVSEGRMHVQRN